MSINKIKQKLQNATLDKAWLEKAEWRKANQDWLDISFSIAVKIGEVLANNKKTDTFPKNQAELAEAMHCSPQYVSKLLKGEENLQIETIVRLSKILGIALIQVPVATEIRRDVTFEFSQSWYRVIRTEKISSQVKDYETEKSGMIFKSPTLLVA